MDSKSLKPVLPKEILDFAEKYLKNKIVDNEQLLNIIEKGIKDSELSVRNGLWLMQGMSIMLTLAAESEVFSVLDKESDVASSLIPSIPKKPPYIA